MNETQDIVDKIIAEKRTIMQKCRAEVINIFSQDPLFKTREKVITPELMRAVNSMFIQVCRDIENLRRIGKWKE